MKLPFFFLIERKHCSYDNKYIDLAGAESKAPVNKFVISINSKLVVSCDTGQRIFGFGSCQLTTAWMRSIRLHAPTLTRKCKILKNWFPFVADGLVGGRTDGHVTTNFFRTYK